MVRYKFFENNIQQLQNDNKTVYIDLDTFEVWEEKDDVRYLFEKFGMGEKNPLATEEEIAKWYKI